MKVHMITVISKSGHTLSCEVSSEIEIFDIVGLVQMGILPDAD